MIMRDHRRIILILSVLTAVFSTSFSVAIYDRTGQCKENACVYDYTIDGEMHDKRGKERAVTAARVTINCESVGVFKRQFVSYYCLTMKDVTVRLLEVKNNELAGKQSIKETSKSDVSSMMNGRFCFVRNNDGKVLSVFHDPNEKTEIVNLKKTVASSFQANFAKTKTTEETDSQSKHTSHYSYLKKGRSTIEHRTVNNKDVSSYSGLKKKNDVEFKSEEDIELDENQVIRRSHGESQTSLTKKVDSEEKDEKQDIPPIEVKSTYTMKLIECMAATVMSDADHLDEQQSWAEELSADHLLARYDERTHDQEEMELLYDELPDLETTARVARDVEGDSSDNGHEIIKWRRLLYLESKYRAELQGQRKPKVVLLIELLEEVLFKNTDNYHELRLTIYSLLSFEGSLDAQQALMNAMRSKDTADEEYQSIVMAITMLSSAHPSTVSSYKQYLQANNTDNEQLLLSFATLGRHKNVESEVVSTITEMLYSILENSNDTSSVIYLIHALGNTGSKLIIPYITPFLASPHSDVQIAAIDACRTISTDKTVQMIFTDIIQQATTVEMIRAIINSLNFPYESFVYFPETPDSAEDNGSTVDEDLINTIVHAAFNDSELHNSTKLFLKNIKKEDLIDKMRTGKHLIKRQSSTYWSSRNSLYNLVAPYDTRVLDMSRYPYHKAYLWAKQLGSSKIHAKIAVGGFGGVGKSRGYKVFGRGIVQLYVYGRTYTALEAEYQTTYETNRGSNVKRYVKICGTTFLSNTATTMSGIKIPYRKAWSKNLYSLPLFYAYYKIWVWIGFLNFHIGGNINIWASLTVNVQSRGANAEVNFGPSLTVYGGASIRLLIIYNVGINVKATIGYYVIPKASVGYCDTSPRGDATACFGIYHGSKGVSVDVYAFSQRLKCRIRRWRKACWWQAKTKLPIFSSGFSLGRSLRQRLLWGKCLACSCRGPIHQYCSKVTGYPPQATSCSCSTTALVV